MTITVFPQPGMRGTQDNGNVVNIPVTAEGHLEVAIHAPLNPFRSVHVDNLRPVYQTDFVYGVNSGQASSTTSGSGSVSTSNSLTTWSTGTTIYS